MTQSRPPRWEQPDQAAAEQYVAQSYAALADRASSTGWERTQDQTTWWLIVDDAFFEVEIDPREQSAFVLLGPLRDGRRPGGYYVDANQAPLRWHVGAALALAGIERSASAAQPAGSTPAEGMRAAIDANRSDVETALSHLDQVVTACRVAAGK